MATRTIALQPISSVWTLVYHTCGTEPSKDDTKIMFHPPVWPFTCSAKWVAGPFPVGLKDATVYVTLAGSYNGPLGHSTGGVEFNVYSQQKGLLASIKLAQLSTTPAQIDVTPNTTLDASDQLTFEVRAYDLSCAGCAPWIEPVEATIVGTPPPAQTYVNVTVYVTNAETGAPVAGARVKVVSEAYNFGASATTDQYGMATINNVPFSQYATYGIYVTASGFQSYYTSLTGSQLARNQFQVNVTLAPSHVPAWLGYLKSAAVWLGVAAASGLAIYAVYVAYRRGYLHRAYGAARAAYARAAPAAASAARAAYQRARELYQRAAGQG